MSTCQHCGQAIPEELLIVKRGERGDTWYWAGSKIGWTLELDQAKRYLRPIDAGKARQRAARPWPSQEPYRPMTEQNRHRWWEAVGAHIQTVRIEGANGEDRTGDSLAWTGSQP